MKKLIFAVIFSLILMPSFVSAELNSSQARWNMAKKMGSCGAGIVTGFMFHELGHQVVAKLEDVETEWDNLKWETFDASKSQVRRISTAGFAFQVLSSEVILRTDAIPKDSSFVLCWLGFNIINQITYPLKNELSSDGYGDIGNYEKHGGKVEHLEIGLIAHAVWSFYRLKNNPDTPFFIRTTRDEIRVGFGWEF